MRQQIASIIVCLAILLSGCAGRTPNPVSEYQYGDQAKSCEHIRAELAQIKADITSKASDKSDSTASNVALGVAGAILFWPALFFMDLSNADKTELEALRRRHNALGRISMEKNCGVKQATGEYVTGTDSNTKAQKATHSPGGGCLSGKWTGEFREGDKVFLCDVSLVQTGSTLQGTVKTISVDGQASYTARGAVNGSTIQIIAQTKECDRSSYGCCPTLRFTLTVDATCSSLAGNSTNTCNNLLIQGTLVPALQ